jgi:extracellular elastinolytic metalloproteinase
MLGDSARRRRRPRAALRRATGATTAALVTAGLVSLGPSAQGSDGPEPVTDRPSRVHRDAGAPLFAKADDTPARQVRAYLEGRGRGPAAESLRTAGAWKTRGIAHLAFEQEVAGLRVHDSYARAAFDSDGNLIDLVENLAPAAKGAHVKAGLGPDDALRIAVESVRPGRRTSPRVTGVKGRTTTYAKDGWYAAPTVERVALPTEDGGMAEGYVVTTWSGDDNDLVETVVSGDGDVVETIRRSADDSYHVFPESPTADGTQTTVQGPGSGNTVSPFGWLSGQSQWATHISGNNVQAYLDTDNDDAPDVATAAENDGIFDAVFDPTDTPASEVNRKVAIQNLFYLNNLIHDTLYTAGFTEAAGNFQEVNPPKVGRDSDSVHAQSQDGGGTDNANFATPRDGRNPRMQMYLWNPPVTHQVAVDGATYDATGADWGTQLTTDGVSGPLALGDDNVVGEGTTPGTETDGCESFGSGSPYAGKLVLVDRGYCPFTQKAHNVQAAGGIGIIVAALASAPAPFHLGGEDPAITIPAVMVSHGDGQTLRTKQGLSTTIRLHPAPAPMRDSGLDSDIVWHEYGHGLTWRMIGRMDGPLAGAVGEGMSDILAVVANDDPVIGEYASSSDTGLRRESYEGYSRTYGDLLGQSVHADGEVYGAIGWDLWKQYQAAGLGKAAILADLVDGMNYTPAKPTYEQMRDGILAGLTNSGHADRACMVWNSFAKYGVGVGAKGSVRGSSLSVRESFTKPVACQP